MLRVLPCIVEVGFFFFSNVPFAPLREEVGKKFRFTCGNGPLIIWLVLHWWEWRWRVDSAVKRCVENQVVQRPRSSDVASFFHTVSNGREFPCKVASGFCESQVQYPNLFHTDKKSLACGTHYENFQFN